MSNRPLNLGDFFGETPANPELYEQVSRAVGKLKGKRETILTENEAFVLGVLVFIYAYSAVEVGRALHYFRQLAALGDIGDYYGWNQLRVLNSPVSPELSYLRRLDNNILYCAAALDLSDEPVLFYTPGIGNRYFSYQLIDSYANSFAYIGTRATRGYEGVFAIVGPGWRGKLSKELSWIQSQTPHNLMFGRIAIGDVEEVSLAREIYSRSTLAPLRYFRKEEGNDLSVGSLPECAQPLDLSGLKWFEFASRLLNHNPPPASENDLIGLFARLNFCPGFDFQARALTTNVRSGLKRSIPVAQNEIIRYARTMGESINGWHISRPGCRLLESNYLERAAIARERLTESAVDEIFNAECFADSQGGLLNGSKKYVLRFEKRQEPSVNAFWSLTQCAIPNQQLANDRNTHNSISSLSPRLKYGADGSIEIHVQNTDPGGDEAGNWLRSPAGNFSLLLRMYLPSEEVISGWYKLPVLHRSA